MGTYHPEMVEPIQVGDLVLCAFHQSNPDGTRAKVIKVDRGGKRCLVRFLESERAGREKYYPRSAVSYSPCEKAISKRTRRVRTSWNDTQLRREMGLPLVTRERLLRFGDTAWD